MKKTIEFENMTIDVEQGLNEIVYTFKGDVDENFKHDEVPRIKKDKIRFILEKLDNFNSCGIREWIYFVKDIENNGSIEFEQCSVAIIDQINMVPDSLGNGKIKSFFAPYFSESQGEISMLIDVEKYKETLLKKQAPEFKDENGEILEFDALEESYFLFLDYMFSK